MSLILDAIKKSERERQQQGVPDLASNHDAYQAETTSKKQWVWSIVTIFTILLLVVIYFVVFTDYFKAENNSKIEFVSDEITQIKQDAKIKSKQNQPQQLISEQPFKATPSVAINKTPIVKEEKEVAVVGLMPTINTQTKNVKKAPNLHQVAVLIQKNFPAIQFSSHVFTGDQATSFVVLNDEMLGVGEMLDDVIKVIQINENNMVIERNGHQVTLNALQNWQP